MEFEFDKEIDSLLRQTARNGEAVFDGKNSSFAASAHVDADEISLFAENALPVKARSRVTEHLADCNRCRKILSGLIALDSETESENVHAKEIIGAAIPLPWYKKLFTFPQIAYAMGALALVFSGVMALMILQNAGNSLNTGIAQRESVQEKSSNTTTATTDAPVANEPYAMTNTSTATTGNTGNGNTMMSTANSSVKSTPQFSTTSNANTALAAPEEKLMAEKPAGEPQAGSVRDTKPASASELALAKPAAPVKKEDFVRDGPPTAKPENENRADKDENLRARQQAETVQAPSVQNQVGILSDSQNVKRNAPAARAENRKSITTGDTVASDAAKNKSAETRTAGGKVFRRADGVWYDPAYKGGATTNIRRGTDEYKKLDAGLRSIAEQIGGTVVVVWKSKAYRIQ